MASFLTLLFGEWNLMTQCLFVLILVDIILGIIDAIVFHVSKYGKGFSSSGLYQGIVRKALMLVVVVVATQADIILGVDFLRSCCVAYLCVTEAVSILENLAKVGVPLPKKLIDILVDAKKEMEDNDKSG